MSYFIWGFVALSIMLVFHVYIGWKIFRKSNSLVWVLAQGIVFYWLELGSWIMTFDELTNGWVYSLGFTYKSYYPIYYRVVYDSYYVKTIILNSGFFLFFQMALLFCVRAAQPSKVELRIKHWPMLGALVAAVSVFALSFRGDYINVIREDIPFYVYYGDQASRNPLKDILLYISAYILFLGIVYFCQNFQRERAKRGGLILNGAIFSLLLLLVLEIVSTGQRRIILQPAIFMFLTFFPLKGKIKYSTILGVSFFLIFISAQAFRNIKPSYFTQHSKFAGAEKILNKGEKVQGFISSSGGGGRSILFSVEMFEPHFSMYISLKEDVQVPLGYSLYYLTHALLPRVVFSSRPAELYQLYTAQIQHKGTQGFGFVQSTSWYLNFGYIGIVIGGFVLGVVTAWTSFVRRFKNVKKFHDMSVFVAYSAVAFLPSLIRNGIEWYRPFLFIGLIVPILIFFVVIEVSNCQLAEGE